MTTEDDFQRVLDANADDHSTRLVFADWLQEREDPRAEGYRALGNQYLFTLSNRNSIWYNADEYEEDPVHENLPPDWFDALVEEDLLVEQDTMGYWFSFPTRREAEDAAALAFAQLPPSAGPSCSPQHRQRGSQRRGSRRRSELRRAVRLPRSYHRRPEPDNSLGKPGREFRPVS